MQIFYFKYNNCVKITKVLSLIFGDFTKIVTKYVFLTNLYLVWLYSIKAMKVYELLKKPVSSLLVNVG